MLRHHHPWEKLKLRLNSNLPANPRGDLKKHRAAVYNSGINYHQEDRHCINGINSAEETELESLRDVEGYTRHATSETSDNDVKYHDAQ